jgi:tRNA (guanine6-N2)-methyltransferase
MKKAFKKRIRINYIKGLEDFVQDELLSLEFNHHMDSHGFVDFIGNYPLLHKAKTISDVYLEFSAKYLNPKYLSNHKSIVGELIEKVLENSNKYEYSTFSLSAAGSDSPELQEIVKYISNEFTLVKEDTGNLKIEIGYRNNEWILSCRTTPRPLSLRSWRVCNIEGGMNSTIAHCINSITYPMPSQRYLNIFSGSATLLIERALENRASDLLGFDYNGKTNACAIQNIKGAGLIKNIAIKNLDINDSPDLGKFDVIVSDLPFGIKISKDLDLYELYKSTVEYILNTLSAEGIAVLYTSKFEILEKVLDDLKIKIDVSYPLVLPTSKGDYLYPRIYKFRK